MDKVELEGRLECTTFFPVFPGDNILDFSNPLLPSDGPNNQSLDQPPISALSPDLVPPEVFDYYDVCLGYIRDVLIEEEDLDGNYAPLQDHRALEATEKSFYDALDQDYYPSFSNQYPFSDCPSNDDFLPGCSNGNDSLGSYGCVNSSSCRIVDESNWPNHQNEFRVIPFVDVSDLATSQSQDSHSRSSGSLVDGFLRSKVDSPARSLSASEASSQKKFVEAKVSNVLINQIEGRRIHQRDETNCQEIERSNKQVASYSEEYFEMEKYDEVLLPKEERDVDLVSSSGNSGRKLEEKLKGDGNSKRPKGRRNREKKRSNGGEAVDLRTLLTQCAQAVASFDLKTATEQLKQLRDNSSPFGDSIQRVAHYFANGLQARLAGSGEHIYSGIINTRVPAHGVLKAYECYVTAIPVYRVSYFLANQMIAKLAEKATRIHVVSFGIFHGYQWPSLIQQLSERPMGPLRLKITGIEYPQ